MAQNSKLRKLKWRKIGKSSKLEVGQIVKGYTYSIGDYHSKISNKNRKWLLGLPKLRLGVIVKKYSNNLFKVQFRNSAAYKLEKSNITNIIEFSKNSKIFFEIRGTDSYCILVHKKRLKFVNTKKTSIVCDINKLNESIFNKHSKNKKRAEKYLVDKKYYGKTKEILDKVLKKWQFSTNELKFDTQKVIEKLEIFKVRHDKNKCIKNEFKKAKELWDFININSLKEDEKEKIYEILREFEEERAILNLFNKFNLKEIEIVLEDLKSKEQKNQCR